MCNKVNILVGTQSFSADFYDSDIADSLIKQLPMTVSMAETENAEYFVPLSQRINCIDDYSKNIVSGDITVYKRRSLSIFFDCQNSDSEYVTVGHIQNPEGLYRALNKCSGFATFQIAD